MCSSTTKAMKSRLSTSTVVGPLCGESKREHNSVRECGECGSAANSLDAAAAGTVREAASRLLTYGKPPSQPQQQQLQRHCAAKRIKKAWQRTSSGPARRQCRSAGCRHPGRRQLGARRQTSAGARPHRGAPSCRQSPPDAASRRLPAAWQAVRHRSVPRQSASEKTQGKKRRVRGGFRRVRRLRDSGRLV